MPGAKHCQFKHAFLMCLPLLTLASLPMGPADAVGDHVRHVPRRVTLTYLRRTLQALEDVLSFFHSQHRDVNLDGVIGTRIVEGTLNVLLARLGKQGGRSVLPPDVDTDLQALHHLATLVSDETEPYVAHNEPAYYERIWPTVHEGTWELDYPTRNLSTTVTLWAFREAEFMREDESDDCLTELFGTSGKTNESCVISDTCWRKMTKLGYHLYTLTHQIFYLQLGELSGCLPEMQLKVRSNGQPTLRELQDVFCANILGEAKLLADRHYPLNHRDLFMEQAGLCGMYGYWEFFRYSWLEKILSWQNRTTGCYHNDNWPDDLSKHVRMKREEIRLANGCLSHMTTVAASALVQYVRYLTEALLDGHVDSNTHQLYWQ